MTTRKYTLRKRADRQERTRDRIVAAAMKLHQELGPADTTISAIADEAGVQRLTVYRHFPTEAEIFGACSTKWLELHPPPDVSTIEHANPGRQTRALLLALYRYFDETAPMWAAVYPDLGKVPVLEETMAGFDAWQAGIAERLVAARAPARSKRLRATVRHAVAFPTWQSLREQGLGSTAMAKLVESWIDAVSG